MRVRYFIILFIIITILWIPLHCSIHKMGHAIACFRFGRQSNGYIITISAGSLTVISFTIVIVQLKKSFFTTYIQFLSIFIDGVYWIIGGWLPASDVGFFCEILGLDTKIFGLNLIPLLVGVSYLLIRKIDKQLDKYIE